MKSQKDMNKQVFMDSMSSASETIMKIGITADKQEQHESALITAAEAGAGDEKAIAIAVADIEKAAWGKTLTAKAEEAFLLVQKSTKAFHTADKGTEWQIIGYDDNLGMFKNMFGTVGTTQDWKVNVVNLATILGEDLEINKLYPSVPHDNGSVWKKNKNDLGRFAKLDQCIEDFKKIVS